MTNRTHQCRVSASRDLQDPPRLPSRRLPETERPENRTSNSTNTWSGSSLWVPQPEVRDRAMTKMANDISMVCRILMSGTIWMFLPNFTNPGYAKIIAGAETAAADRGYVHVEGSSDAGRNGEKSYFDLLGQGTRLTVSCPLIRTWHAVSSIMEGALGRSLVGRARVAGAVRAGGSRGCRR